MMPRSYWIFLAAMYSIVGIALLVSWRRRRHSDVFRPGHGAQRDAATAVLPPTLLAHETAGPGHLQRQDRYPGYLGVPRPLGGHLARGDGTGGERTADPVTAGPGRQLCPAEMKDARWHECGLDAGHVGDHRCILCGRLFTGKVLLA